MWSPQQGIFCPHFATSTSAYLPYRMTKCIVGKKSYFLTQIRQGYCFLERKSIGDWTYGEVTSSWIWCLMPHMKKVPVPCNVAKSIIAVPSQVWYLTETSNWRPSNWNTAILLKIGRRRRAKQASVNKPNRVATLNILYCHLKIVENGQSWDIISHGAGCSLTVFYLHCQLEIFYLDGLLEIVRNASVESPCQKDDEEWCSKDFNPRQDA